LKGARKPVNIGTDEFVRLRGCAGRRDEWARAHFLFGLFSGEAAAGVRGGFSGYGVRCGTDSRHRAACGGLARLDVVEIEFLGGAKHRILRVFIEKNAEERKKLAEQAAEAAAAAGAGMDQLAGVTHEDCAAFSRDFGRFWMWKI